MRIAVLGAAGQLGRDLCPWLAALGHVLPLSRADLDLARPDAVGPALDAHAPDVFVNCAAYNLVDKAEADGAADAHAVNADGVGALAAACAARGVRFVHFSTDYVFGRDAARAAPYAETDAPGPVSVYGESKLRGEQLALAAGPRHLVIRTCGLYGVWGTGGKGGNFVETMLRVAGQGKPLRVVNDQRCTPSYTADVAAAAVSLIASAAAGLFHVTSAGDCTWYEFASEIFRLAQLEPDLTPVTSAEFGAKARRPPYSVLSNAQLASVGISPPRNWTDALAAYLQERANKPA